MTLQFSTYLLQPGELMVSGHYPSVSTILGSCVAICLWDERKKIGGINHIVLPSCGEKPPTTKYANVATFVLCDLLEKEGCNRRHLKARVFGGSCHNINKEANPNIYVGAKNIEISLAVLKKLKIPITGEDLGGSFGRKIIFDFQTGKIKMSYLDDSNVIQKEKLLSKKVICIGASTGGAEAIEIILKTMPASFPGVVIVQHIPEAFTKTFVERLDRICTHHEVLEATNLDWIEPGKVLVAPGNKHVKLKEKNSSYYVVLDDGPKVCRHRPSVDVLFQSVSEVAGKSAIGVILTGMGADGAAGLLSMRNAGARTLAQDQESCVVYGMPKEALKNSGAERSVPLIEITKTIKSLL